MRKKVGFWLNIILSQLLFQWKKVCGHVLKIYLIKGDERRCMLLPSFFFFVRIETRETVMTNFFQIKMNWEISTGIYCFSFSGIGKN